MIRIYQTRYGDRKTDDQKGGNCFQAVLASLFELSLEEVPDFCNIYPLGTMEWYEKYIDWLNDRGYSVVTIDLKLVSLESRNLDGCTLIVTGPNKNGIQHCVIYKNGKPIHNPNKYCLGITPSVADIIFPLCPKGRIDDPEKD